MPKNSTETLADWVVGLDYESIPDAVVARACRQCLDLIGVALAGSTEDAARIARSVCAQPSSSDVATVWGTSTTTSTFAAAFVNGIAAHALDFDDVWLPGAHPSAPILPAAFAVAEGNHLNGRELVASMVAGYEVMGRLHSAVSETNRWHPTAVFGTFGATAACCRLLGLSVDQAATAFGVASSLTGGIQQGGSMVKPLHAGHAAESGVRSALYAELGFTGSDRAFEGRDSFFDAFFPGQRIQTWRLTAGLGESFHLLNPGIGIKQYPAGYYMHQTFEATLAIVEANDLGVEVIDHISIGAAPGTPFDRPVLRSELDAKFSLQYMAAMAVLQRSLTNESFAPGTVRSPAVASIMSRIVVRADRTLPDNYDIAYNPVTVVCADGREFTSAVPLPRSHWRYPIEDQTVTEKFVRNATGILDPDTIRELGEALTNLPGVGDVADIATLLQPAPVRVQK